MALAKAEGKLSWSTNLASDVPMVWDKSGRRNRERKRKRERSKRQSNERFSADRVRTQEIKILKIESILQLQMECRF